MAGRQSFGGLGTFELVSAEATDLRPPHPASQARASELDVARQPEDHQHNQDHAEYSDATGSHVGLPFSKRYRFILAMKVEPLAGWRTASE